MKRFILVQLLFISSLCGYAQNSIQEAFTVHPKGKSVKCYEDQKMKSLRYVIYPLKEEGNAGTIVQLRYSDKNFLTILFNGDICYVKKGCLAVNTRNYSGQTLYLYEKPSDKAKIVYQTTQEHTVTIYNLDNGWFYVRLRLPNGKDVYGWLEPAMQCPNPFTTCC